MLLLDSLFKPSSVNFPFNYVNSINGVNAILYRLDEPEVSEVLQKLSPGNILSDIGFAPRLLSKRSLQRVQDVCLAAKGTQLIHFIFTSHNAQQCFLYYSITKYRALNLNG